MKTKACIGSTMRKVFGQPSWRLASTTVEAFVTETGGHLGPVKFNLHGRKLEPFSVAPWAEEKTDPSLAPILKVLRGDFFCMPFGGNATAFGRERHPIHGETANARWQFQSLESADGRVCLRLSLRTKIRKGRVDKMIFLVNGHNAVYSRHIVSEMTGPMNFGHHAMLRFPDEPGSGVISTSRFVYGQVFPGVFESPEQRGYCFLKAGAEFDSLERVPAITGEFADLTRYPARRGFEDLVMVVSDSDVPFAWVAVTFPRQRYVWFALKDPRVLRETVFWISNGGRHYPPWNGRHINVMGLEDVTAYFHYGLAESVGANPITKMGYPTCVSLRPDRPLIVNYIMAVAPVPAGFDRVLAIEPAANPNTVTLRAANGKSVTVPLEISFLQAAER